METYRDLFTLLIFLIISATGAPITQSIKNYFNLEDRQALAVAAGIAFILAVLELILIGTYSGITLATIPTAFFATYGVANIYYNFFKNSSGVLGKGLVLKERE